MIDTETNIHEETHKGENLFFLGCQESFNFCTSFIFEHQLKWGYDLCLQAPTCRENPLSSFL